MCVEDAIILITFLGRECIMCRKNVLTIAAVAMFTLTEEE